MAKKRKTRQDKIIADLRHQLSVSTPPAVKYDKTISETKVVLSPSYESSYKPQMVDQTVIIADLRKTITITSAFIFSQLLLYLLLKNHIIAIPGLSY